jgi:dTDP-4-dehydrorhamnose 3,5-epimerase
MRQDRQTVTPAGERLEPLPDSMEIRDLVTHADERGTVCELYDEPWSFSPDALVFADLFAPTVGGFCRSRAASSTERNIGHVDVQVINFPTIAYEHENPDKYRLPLDTDELPVTLGPEWRGW